jgi:hypothetical protein
MLAHRVETFGMTWAVLVLCAELAFFGSRVHALRADLRADAAAKTQQAELDRIRHDIDALTQELPVAAPGPTSDAEIAAARHRLDELRDKIEVLKRARPHSIPGCQRRVPILDAELVLPPNR